ncbi:RES family NAD+ phosphorylase [Rhizobium sp. RHZ02]|jgi:hypothetical protein|uniref:RES family NAD+ phosphorylase n=1 Tax=Rhizobium sp. RHZ02 TaxID=2769306 RepID=UPI0017821EAA|nr:RES family NAD+ phosphorylase [Rhizobium sp. RHZ02]
MFARTETDRLQHARRKAVHILQRARTRGVGESRLVGYRQAFSTPADRSDDAAEYAPTQILAELFRSLGYDGVAYKSAFGEEGDNIAIFNIDDFEVEWC